MKVRLIPSSNISLGGELFANNRPFETSITRSFGQMRTRRSPSLAGLDVSIQNHFRNRQYYWFTSQWNLTVNNFRFNSIGGTIQIGAQHNSGTGAFASRARNTIFTVTGVGVFSTSFNPPTSGFNTMIMDNNASSNLRFFVNVFDVSGSVNINFDWGFGHTQSANQASFISTNKALGTWGTGGGVNVTVNILAGGGGPGGIL